jgi:hypothetical protein
MNVSFDEDNNCMHVLRQAPEKEDCRGIQADISLGTTTQHVHEKGCTCTTIFCFTFLRNPNSFTKKEGKMNGAAIATEACTIIECPVQCQIRNY